MVRAHLMAVSDGMAFTDAYNDYSFRFLPILIHAIFSADLANSVNTMNNLQSQLTENKLVKDVRLAVLKPVRSFLLAMKLGLNSHI